MVSLIVTDVDATIQHAYHDAAPVLPLVMDQLIGQSLIGLFENDDQPHLLGHLHHWAIDEVKDLRFALSSSDRQPQSVRITIIPVCDVHGVLVALHWLLHGESEEQRKTNVPRRREERS